MSFLYSVIGYSSGYDLENKGEIVYAAITEINELLSNFTKGTITKPELDYYETHKSELKAICEAMNSGKHPCGPLFSEISDAMKICFDKLDVIKKQHSQLTVVMEYCKSISIGK